MKEDVRVGDFFCVCVDDSNIDYWFPESHALVWWLSLKCFSFACPWLNGAGFISIMIYKRCMSNTHNKNGHKLC